MCLDEMRPKAKDFSNDISRWIWYETKVEDVKKHLIATVKYGGGFLMTLFSEGSENFDRMD